MNFITASACKVYAGGETSLGPALLASVAMAGEGTPGSMVVLCTDGMANNGLGSFESPPEEFEPFYENVGEYAKDKGVMINILAILGAEANL